MELGNSVSMLGELTTKLEREKSLVIAERNNAIIQRDKLSAELVKVYRSRSWRLTKPLRAILSMLNPGGRMQKEVPSDLVDDIASKATTSVQIENPPSSSQEFTDRILVAARLEQFSRDLEGYKNALSQAETLISRYANQFGRLPSSAGDSNPDYGSPNGPSIVIASMPKSGTVYVNRLLSKGLNYWSYDIGYSHFPQATADFRRLRVVAQGGWVSSQHFEADVLSINRLDKYIKRWVVHVRDPRSVLVSWAHHLDYYGRRDPDDVDDWFYPQPVSSYLDLDITAKIDWCIENFLPVVMAWLKNWLLVIDSNKYQILLTTYDQLVASEEDFVKSILKFHGIPSAEFVMPIIGKNMGESHFRSGRSDEWREVMSPLQLVKANEFIGTQILDRFGWSR